MPEIVKLRDPVELIAAIPYLIGFHPADCFVVCGLASDSPVLHLRVDAEAGSRPAALARMLCGHLQRAGAESMILVGYDERAHAALEDLSGELRSGPIPVLDVLSVVRGRWRSLLCESQTCCPPDGNPTPDPSRLPVVAQLVASGRVARSDRVALIADVAGDSQRQAEVEECLGALPARATGAPATQLRGWVDDAAGIAGGDPMPSASRSAELLASLRDIRVRDALMGAIEAGTPGLESLLCWLASGCPKAQAAPILTLTALPAWLRGDGARAAQLLELAVAADPGYRLAQLLRCGLSTGMPPEEIAAVCQSAAVADDEAEAAAS